MRAGAFAAVCVGLSEAGHDLMASRPAPVWAGWTALAGVTAIGYVLADRRRQAWWILLAVQAVQVFLHVWFSAATRVGRGPVPRRPHLAMHGAHRIADAGSPMVMGHGGGTSASMVGAHALAGVVVAVWLYAGERALWRALGVIAGSFLGRVLRAFVLLAYAGSAADRLRRGGERGRGEDQASTGGAALRHVLVRRGPPRADGVVEYAAM